MSKKIGKKIWIYVGVGVFLVIVGIISWGVATDWKFIGDSKNLKEVVHLHLLLHLRLHLQVINVMGNVKKMKHVVKV